MIWVIYATRSRIIRRVIVPDPGMRRSDHVGDGESALTIDDPADIETALPPGRGPDLQLIGDRIHGSTGLRPLESRCVVVDADNNVVRVVSADPDLDAVPDGELVLDAKAEPGWKRRGGQFEPPPAQGAAADVMPDNPPPRRG